MCIHIVMIQLGNCNIWIFPKCNHFATFAAISLPFNLLNDLADAFLFVKRPESCLLGLNTCLTVKRDLCFCCWILIHNKSKYNRTRSWCCYVYYSNIIYRQLLCNCMNSLSNLLNVFIVWISTGIFKCEILSLEIQIEKTCWQKLNNIN